MVLELVKAGYNQFKVKAKFIAGAIMDFERKSVLICSEEIVVVVNINDEDIA